MAKDPVPELLARATEALELEFAVLPEFEAERGPGAGELAAVLEETVQRLGCGSVRASLAHVFGH